MYEGRDRYLAFADACRALIEIRADESVAQVAVSVVEHVLPELAAAVYLEDDSCSSDVARFDLPLAIVAVESDGYSFGRIEIFGTRHELDERDFAALELVAVLVADAIKLRALSVSDRQRTALVYKAADLEQALDESKQTLRESLNDQEVRARLLADALQEDVSQNLAAVILGLQKIELGADDSNEVATRLRELSIETVNIVRGLVADLVPPALEEFGLVAALRGLVRAQSLAVELVIPDVVPRISPDAAAVCYRLIKEFIRVGSTTRSVAQGRIELIPSDRGDFVAEVTASGSDPPDLKRWELMRSWVEAVNGRLTMSASSGGTRFKLQFPSAVVPTPSSQTAAVTV